MKYRKVRDMPKFTLNGCQIEETEFYNYLGVTFTDANDRFEKHVQDKYDKALRAIFSSRSLAYEAAGPYTTYNIKMKTFDTQIQPIVNYGCEVWYNGKHRFRVEALHTKYMKHALGVKNLTSNLAVYGETGRYAMLTRQEQLVLGYRLRIISVPVTNPVRSVYIELLRLSHAGHHTWCTNVAILIRSVGFMDVWESQTIPSDSAQICSLKHNLKKAAVQKYADEWENEVNETGKHPILRTYIKF